MELAILVFFLAIFGGILFLLALVWYFVRRARNKVSSRSNFSGGASRGSGAVHTSFSDGDDDAAALYAGSSFYASDDPENRSSAETARDAANVTENSYAHESHGAFAAPAEPSYASSESSSSYDSGSSSSSDTSSSDSGGSSSSSSSD